MPDLRLRLPAVRLEFALVSTLLVINFFTGVESSRATPPEIGLIELYRTNQVLIHFDTDANRTYTVQFINKLPRPGETAVWSNLYTAPVGPFPNHFIVPDVRSTPVRFYRLKVTP